MTQDPPSIARVRSQMVAYNEIERIGLEALAQHSAAEFSDLPADVRSDLLARQAEILAKHGVEKDDFNTDLDFIGVD